VLILQLENQRIVLEEKFILILSRLKRVLAPEDIRSKTE
jgi:hypothetical protein